MFPAITPGACACGCANCRLIVALIIWAAVSYGCSILYVEQLNALRIGQLPLGFWFSQQGSIYVFVVLVLVYAFAMDSFNKRYGKEEVRRGAAAAANEGQQSTVASGVETEAGAEAGAGTDAEKDIMYRPAALRSVDYACG